MSKSAVRAILWRIWVLIRAAIFGKIWNRSKPDTNEMETTEIKHQTDFYSAKNTNIQQNFNKGFLKISIKYF